MREIRFSNFHDASMYNKGYEQGRADEREKVIKEYKSNLKEDVLARAKYYSEHSDKINAEVFNYATDTFVQALDCFAERLMTDK